MKRSARRKSVHPLKAEPEAEAHDAVPAASTHLRPFPFVNRVMPLIPCDEADYLLDELLWRRMRAALGQIDVRPSKDLDALEQAVQQLTQSAVDHERLLVVTSIVHRLLRYLYEAACAWRPEHCGGSVPPVTILAALSEYSIRCLRQVPTDSLKPTAECLEEWPSMVGQKDLVHRVRKSTAEEDPHLSTTRDWLDSIALGTHVLVKSRSGSVPSLFAQRMVDTIEANRDLMRGWPNQSPDRYQPRPDWVVRCSTLPALSPDSWKQWFEVGWSALLEATKGQPEKDESLNPLGQYRLGRASHPEKKSVYIREGIKASLQQAFKELVVSKSKAPSTAQQ